MSNSEAFSFEVNDAVLLSDTRFARVLVKQGKQVAIEYTDGAKGTVSEDEIIAVDSRSWEEIVERDLSRQTIVLAAANRFSHVAALTAPEAAPVIEMVEPSDDLDPAIFSAILPDADAISKLAALYDATQKRLTELETEHATVIDQLEHTRDRQNLLSETLDTVIADLMPGYPVEEVPGVDAIYDLKAAFKQVQTDLQNTQTERDQVRADLSHQIFEHDRLRKQVEDDAAARTPTPGEAHFLRQKVSKLEIELHDHKTSNWRKRYEDAQQQIKRLTDERDQALGLSQIDAAAIATDAHEVQPVQVQTVTWIQDMSTPEQRQTADKKVSEAINDGWRNVHESFNFPFNHRAIRWEYDAPAQSPAPAEVSAAAKIERDWDAVLNNATSEMEIPVLEGELIGVLDEAAVTLRGHVPTFQQITDALLSGDINIHEFSRFSTALALHNTTYGAIIQEVSIL